MRDHHGREVGVVDWFRESDCLLGTSTEHDLNVTVKNMGHGGGRWDTDFEQDPGEHASVHKRAQIS